MIILMLILNWLFSIIFIFLNHPLSLGSMLLAQTLLISLISGQFFYNYWFSYILFLVMIGGMLVMFIYMTSIASNEKFKYSKYLFMLFSVIFMLSIMMIWATDSLYINLFVSMIDSNIDNKIKLSLNKLYNYPNYQIMLFLMSYLLITLIAIVKIVGKNIGTLRQK